MARVQSSSLSSSSLSSLKMVIPTEAMQGVNNTLVAAANADPDYTYGQVAAPSWAFPLDAVLAVATAALPFLLKPGEKALEQQRLGEEGTKSGFGQGKNRVS